MLSSFRHLLLMPLILFSSLVFAQESPFIEYEVDPEAINYYDWEQLFLDKLPVYLNQQKFEISVNTMKSSKKLVFPFVRVRVCNLLAVKEEAASEVAPPNTTLWPKFPNLTAQPTATPQPTPAADCTLIARFAPKIEKKDRTIKIVPIKRWSDGSVAGIFEKGAWVEVEVSDFGKGIIASSRVEARTFIRNAVFGANNWVIKLNPAAGEEFSINMRVAHRDSDALSIAGLQNDSLLSPLKLIDVLSKDQEFAHEFASDAGVIEGYTIKEHSLRVLELVDQQMNCFFDPEFEARMVSVIGNGFRNFMRITMALHDIGKHQAVVATGFTFDQHKFTRPLLERGVRLAGYNDRAVEISGTLVDNDVIGEYLQGIVPIQKTIYRLFELAKVAKLSLADYWKLQAAFYTSDAGSYPSIAGFYFKRDARGCILPKTPVFSALHSAIISTK